MPGEWECFPPRFTSLNQLWNWLMVGHWLQRHSSDESHFPMVFFSPSQTIISPCLQRRRPLADGGFTLGAVTQCAPWAAGTELRRRWELQSTEGAAAAVSLAVCGAQQALVWRWDTGAWAAPEEPFCRNRWSLQALLCQSELWLGLVCRAGKLPGQHESCAGAAEFGVAEMWC